MHKAVNVMLAACLAACSQSTAASPSAAGEQPAQDETSATEPAAACVPHAEPAASTLTAPVDFAKDVAPIFASSCAFSACHGSKGPGNHGLYLGAGAPENFDAVKASLAGKSKAAPSMAYVTPGDLTNSFVMHKLDGDQCTLAEKCTGGDCGRSMPSGNDLLPEEKRDAIRRWIAQGAK